VAAQQVMAPEKLVMPSSTCELYNTTTATTTLVLQRPVSKDNLSKPVPEYQTTLVVGRQEEHPT